MGNERWFDEILNYPGRFAALASATSYVGAAPELLSAIPPAPDHGLHPKSDLENLTIHGAELGAATFAVLGWRATRRAFRGYVGPKDVL